MAKLLVKPPPAAMAGKLAMPCGVAPVVLTVKVLSTNPFEGSVTTAGLNEQAAPEGRGPQVRLTGALKVLPEVTRHVQDHAKSGTWTARC
jgi:hypothetical protein